MRVLLMMMGRAGIAFELIVGHFVGERCLAPRRCCPRVGDGDGVVVFGSGRGAMGFSWEKSVLRRTLVRCVLLLPE